MLVRSLKLVGLTTAVLLLAGCMYYGAKFVPVSGAVGQAVVYVYRESGVIGHGMDLEVFANRASIARLQVGTYEGFHLPPGQYAFTATPHKTHTVVLSGIEERGIHGNTLLRLEVQQGHTYYLRLEEGLGSLLIDSVSRERAQPILAKLGQAGDAAKKG